MVNALKRELIEEPGFPAKIGTYLGALEHFWENDDQPHHEIDHYFSAFLSAHLKKVFCNRINRIQSSSGFKHPN